MIVHAVRGLDHLAGLGELAVAALLGREVDDRPSPASSASTMSFGPQLRRRPAGDERGRDDDVDLLRLRAEQRVLGSRNSWLIAFA